MAYQGELLVTGEPSSLPTFGKHLVVTWKLKTTTPQLTTPKQMVNQNASMLSWNNTYEPMSML